MKNCFIILIFILLIGCSNNKKVYWCGDHQCINKKEKESYFKKTMIVEIKEIQRSNKNKSEFEKIKKQALTNQKKRIKEEKELAKQAGLEEEIRINKKNKSPDKTIKINTGFAEVSFSTTQFNDLLEKINKKNMFRPFPDINDIPN